jgi:DNA modification methylase
MKAIKITCTGAATLDIDQLTGFQGELKELSKENYAKLRKAIEGYGFSFPIFVWRNGDKNNILDGHQRVLTLKLMREEGWTVPPLPVIYVSALDQKEAKAKLLLAISQYGKISEDGLYSFINDAGMDMDFLKDGFDLPGINFDKFEANFGHDNGDGEEIPDPQDEKAEELLLLYRVEKGQIWQLGDHRLYCGDCRDADGLRRMFAGEKAALLNTDAPYGIAYDSVATKPGNQKPKWEMIESDDNVNENIQPFLEECFAALKADALAPNAAWYLWHANLTGAFYAAAAAAADVLLHKQIVWKKPRFIIGMGMYHWAHECAFMGWVRGNKPPFYGERNQTTVWEIDYDGKKNPVGRIHPTQKPVELFRRPILNHTKPGEICAEPFSGSGSQIMAAELTGRRCYAAEIAPKYCAVTIQRWVDLTGKKPEIIKP